MKDKLFLREGTLMLRAVEPQDAMEMWEFESDSSQWFNNGLTAPYSKKNLLDYAEGYDADPFRAGELRLVICKENETVGLVDLYEISALNRTSFIGIYIKEQFRRQGLACAALTLTESFARELLNLRIFGVKIMEGNEASLRLFKKLDFEKCGEMKNWLLRGSKSHTLFIYTKQISE